MTIFERFPEIIGAQEWLGKEPLTERLTFLVKWFEYRSPTPLELDWYIAGGTDSPTDILRDLNHQEAGMDGCDSCGSYNVLGPPPRWTRDELLVLCPGCWDEYGREMEERRQEYESMVMGGL